MCCCCFSFNTFTSTCIDIALIVTTGISFFLSFLALCIVKWKNIGKSSLAMVLLIFFLAVALLVITVLIFYWRKNGSIKSSTKDLAQKLSIVGLVLSIILFIFCFIGDIVLAIDFSKANHPCNGYVVTYVGGIIIRNLLDKDSVDCDNYGDSDAFFEIVTIGQYFIAYLCLTYTEIAMIVAIFLWRSSKLRILQGIDGIINGEQEAQQQQQVQNIQGQPVVIQQQIVIQGSGDNGQIQPQYIIVQGDGQNTQGQYIVQQNDPVPNNNTNNNNLYSKPNKGGYNNQYQVQNDMLKPGYNYPVNQEMSSDRKFNKPS